MDFRKTTMISKELTIRQAAFGDVYCFSNKCKGEKCVILDANVTTARSIFGCGKCGAWSLVHKVPVTLQKQVKTTSTDKTRFFFAKRMNLLRCQQFFIDVLIPLTKYSKNRNVQFLWTIKFKIFRRFVLPNIRKRKMSLHFNQKKSSFYGFKKCKGSRRVLNITFKKQKLTMTLFGGDGTCCCAKRQVRTNKSCLL